MSLLCVQLLSGTLHFEAAAAGEYSEDSVKAAYLYRFAGYVGWPDAAESRRFVIAVVDSPGVARELKRLAAGHQVNNRPVDVVEAGRIRDAGRPAILYIGSGRAGILRPALGDLAAKSTLVVNRARIWRSGSTGCAHTTGCSTSSSPRFSARRGA